MFFVVVGVFPALPFVSLPNFIFGPQTSENKFLQNPDFVCHKMTHVLDSFTVH
jgi:hypothetical protein